MITEQTVISHIGILEDGQLQIRRSRRVYDDTTLLAETYHRYVLEPGDVVAGEDGRVRAVAAVLWTPAVIAARQRVKQQQQTP